jgi:hypothetical protein
MGLLGRQATAAATPTRPGIYAPDSVERERGARMAAKEKKTDAAPKKTTTRRAPSKTTAAAPEITEEMIAERAYHISQSGEGSTDEENWHRAEAELRSGAAL